MLVTTRQRDDIERLTISVTGTNRGVMFSELGDEIGRLLPTAGEVVSTEEFTLRADSLPDLLSEFIGVVQDGIDDGMAYTLWQCTFAFSMPGNRYKLYVLAHTEELETLVELTPIATKWFAQKDIKDEVAEIIMRVPAVLG